MKEKLPNCKISLPRLIRRADNKVARLVVDDGITNLKELLIDMIGNENTTSKDPEKKGLDLNQHGLQNSPEIS